MTHTLDKISTLFWYLLHPLTTLGEMPTIPKLPKFTMFQVPKSRSKSTWKVFQRGTAAVVAARCAKTGMGAPVRQNRLKWTKTDPQKKDQIGVKMGQHRHVCHKGQKAPAV